MVSLANRLLTQRPHQRFFIQSLIKSESCGLLKSGKYVAVGVEGQLDTGMAETLLDDLWVDPLSQHQRGVGVTEVVETNSFNACPSRRLAECVGHHIGG